MFNFKMHYVCEKPLSLDKGICTLPSQSGQLNGKLLSIKYFVVGPLENTEV